MLAADDGAYVVPVDERMGYAETALTEPWACVEAAYTQRRRLRPLAGGRCWIIGRPDDARAVYGSATCCRDRRDRPERTPARQLERAVRAAAPGAAIRTQPLDGRDGPFDDVIAARDPIRGHDLSGPPTRSPSAARWRSSATSRSTGRRDRRRPDPLPLHGLPRYDAAPMCQPRTARRATAPSIRPGGVTVVVGAAGPMGQMHIERALGMPDGSAAGHRRGPRRAIGSTPRARKLGRWRLSAAARWSCRALGPEPDALRTAIASLTGGRGADDVIVTAP